MPDTLSIIFALFALIAVVGVRMAYHNGLRDGYGYAKHPVSAEFHKAGVLIRKWQRHERHA